MPGTLTVKFYSKDANKDLLLSRRGSILSFGSVRANVMYGRERSFSTFNSTCEMKTLGNKTTEVLETIALNQNVVRFDPLMNGIPHLSLEVIR